MKTVIPIAFALTCAFPLNAQITITYNHAMTRGSREIKLRNDSPITLVAYATSIRQASPAFADIYSDVAIDTEATPLPPNQERAVRWLTRSAPGQPVDHAEPVIFTAGIFADGTTTGDALLLHRLMLRRSNTLLAVELVLEALSDAQRQGTSLYQLIVQFKKMTNSLHRWYLPPEQQIGLKVYEPILGKLMHMPKAKPGSPEPLAAFLDEETTSLRKRRIALAESQPSLVIH